MEKPLQNGKISRVCLQALNYPEVFAHLTAIVKAMRHKTNLPISTSCQPLNERNMGELAKTGVERIGIPLDAATKDLFDKVKGMSAGGPYDWDRQFRLLDTAGRVFGKGNVSTHLIVGLGETEEEMIRTIQRCVDIGVLPGLFAFTPIVGTALENKPPPKIEAYRRVQMARHLIVKGIVKCDDMCFDKEGCIIHFGVAEHALQQIAQSGEPFLTSGCPNCNRPYYNEKPSGPIYNYPKGLTNKEIALVQKELGFEEA
jgi:biotin synthase